MTETIRQKHKAEVIRQWLQATDQALAGLQEWRERLVSWGDGGLAGREDLEQALGLLDLAGLTEWWDWCPAGGGIDALAEVLGPGDAKKS